LNSIHIQKVRCTEQKI